MAKFDRKLERGKPILAPSPSKLASRSLRTSLREAWVEVPRTVRLALRFARGGIAMLSVLTLLAALTPLAMAYVGKQIVDAVVRQDHNGTLRWVGAELALAFVALLITRLSGYVRTIVGARLGVDINVIILEKAQTLELRHFEDPEVYDQLSKARREASSRPLSVVTGLFGLVQHALTLLGTIGLLLHVDAIAVVGLLLAAVPATVAEMRFSAAAFRLRNFRAPDTRRLSYLEFLLGNEGNAKELMLFGLGPTILDRYRDLAERMFRDDRALAARRTVWGAALSLLALGVFYGFYADVAGQAAAALLTLGNLTLYVVAFRQGQQSFQALLSTLGGMFEDNLYMSNLFSFLHIETTEETVDGRAARSEPRKPARIELDDVGFRYPGKETWALRHVSLTFEPGQRVALVGDNGSGKTTLIKLLTRLYEPTEGMIRVDGRDIRTMSKGELRARIGVIFQDFVRYQLSLSENVGFGSVAHLEDMPRMQGALERGGADDLATSLPQGADTQLGRWFSREGTELSGGQWQRIALSRAFMREEADMLILDEPTSALDAEAEQAVFERFARLSQGKTTMLISHRFSTVRSADQIIVLRGGQVLEQGSHASLMAKGGRYSELFQLQARGYLGDAAG